MNKKSDRLNQLVGAIFTESRDIGCDSAEKQIANVSALALSHGDVAQRDPALWQHMRFCADCRQLFVMVTAFDSAEQAGLLPLPKPIPPLPPLPRKRSLQERWERFMQRVDTLSATLVPFGGFELSAAQPLLRGDNSPNDPVEAAFLNGAMVVELDSMPNEENAQRRDLICIFSSEDEQLQADLEEVQLWLESAENGSIIACVALDSDGEATFEYIETGTYILHWRMAKQLLKMPNINII